MEETDVFNGFHFSNQLICKRHRHEAELIKTAQKRNIKKGILTRKGFPSLAHDSFTGESGTPCWTHGSSCKAGSVSRASEVIFDHLYNGYDRWSLQTKASIERGCCSIVRKCVQTPDLPLALRAQGTVLRLGCLGQAACGQCLQQPLASLPLTTSV